MRQNLPGRRSNQRIVALWGLKTTDYGYLDEFYPARRLKEACNNRGLELRFLFPQDLGEFLEGEGYNATQSSDRNADRKETLFLIRGAVPLGTVRFLEERGYPCVNSSQSLALVSDKLEAARFLSRNGWPTPETKEAFPEGHSPNRIVPLSFPFILKPRNGSRGIGVTLVSSPEEYADAFTGPLPTGGLVAQKYVASSHGRDLRVFFVGGRILAVAERQSADGSLLSNASTGGILGPHAIPPGELEPWLGMALAIGKKADLWYGTVDYLFLERPSSGGAVNLTVCEVNGSPGFEALEHGLGIDVAGMLVDALLESFFPEQLL